MWLVAAHLALLGIFDLAASPVWTLVVLGVGFLAWGLALRRSTPVVSAALVLAVAAILRLIVLPLPPTLSDDLLRYTWDGRVVASGANPYLMAPESEQLAELRDERWRRMPHKEVPTVYPPLALGAFALASRLPDPLFGTKIVLAFADLAACALLVALARRLGLAPGTAIAYAWNPLVVLETAGQGHVDALMVPFTIAAVLCLIRARPSLAGLAAAGGVLAKLVPLVALPIWFRHAIDSGQLRGGLRFVVATAAALAVTLVPLLLVTGVPPGLVTYSVSWEFNGPIYEPLWRSIDRLDLVPTVKGWIDRVKTWDDHDDRWNRLYPYVYPQFLAKLLLLGGFGLFVARELWLRRHPVAATGRLFGAVIFAMATVYPWYLLCVLPWAALGRRRSWLTLSVLMPLAYLPQHVAGIDLFPWVWAVIWLPFVTLLLLEPPWDLPPWPDTD